MLRKNSLKKNKEFHFVYRVGKSEGSHSCTLIYAKARHKTVKVGFSVSKKVGNAVTRNKIKRRMRDAFFHIMPKVQPGYSLVFVAKPSCTTFPYQKLQKDMYYVLQRAGLVSKEDARRVLDAYNQARTPTVKKHEENSYCSHPPISENAL